MYGVMDSGASWRNGRQKLRETSFSPSLFFLFSWSFLKRWWSKVFWHLCIGRARHPGPSNDGLAIEVFNVGGWLTHEDLVLEAPVDFMAVVEHCVIPAECVVNGPGYGLRVVPLYGRLSLRKVLMLVMRTPATAQFKRFFDCVRALRCMLPVASGRFLHLVVWLGIRVLTMMLSSLL